MRLSWQWVVIHGLQIAAGVLLYVFGHTEMGALLVGSGAGGAALPNAVRPRP